MKKFLLLVLTILMGAMWNSVDARWIVGERKNASQLQAGDTIVLEQASRTKYLEYYLRAVNTDNGVEVLQGIGAGSASILVLEEGPLDIRTGSPTVYIKLLETGQYLGKDDNWGGDHGCGVVDDVADAANFEILSCGEDIPWSNVYGWDDYGSEENKMKDENGNSLYRNRITGEWFHDGKVDNWRSNDDGRGSDDNSVGFCWSKRTDSFKYLGYWSSMKPKVILWTYTDTNQWNAYEVTYEKSLQDDLVALAQQYMDEGDYLPGTDPGFYDAEVVDAYNAALQHAIEISVTSASDEECIAASDNLKEAHNALASARVPITEGYYFFVVAFEKYLSEYGHEKAAYIEDGKGKLYQKTFDPENVDFVFEVTKASGDNNYWVQNYVSDLYVGSPSDWYGQSIPVTTDKEEAQNIRYYDGGTSTGKWFWASESQPWCSYTYLSGNGTPGDSNGDLWNWGQWGDGGTVSDQYNCWYLRKISDEQMAVFEVLKAQRKRTAELKALVKEATDIYGKLFVYDTDFTTPLITNYNGGVEEEPTEDAQITFSNIRVQGVSYADKYEYLFDGNDTTYMTGSGYARIKLNEPKQIVTFVFNTRDASGQGSNPEWKEQGMKERPYLVDLYGYNSAEDSVFGGPIATDIDMSVLPIPATYTFNFGRPVDRIAYQVNQNCDGGTRFTFSEFQVYEANVNQETSQYYTSEGLSEPADAMNALIPQMSDIVEANTATDEDIQTMKAALDAVKELYADTSELDALIAESETILAGVEVGDEMGQLSDEGLKTALEQAIADARENAYTTPLSAAAIRTATTAVSAAKAALLAGIKSIEEGKWYYIVNNDPNTRAGEAGEEDSFCYGNAIYFKKKETSSSLTKWGLFDEGSMSLNADNNPKAMWRFVAVEGTDYYAIQNLYTGYYLGDYAGEDVNVPYSETPVPYEIAFVGHGQFLLYPRGGKNKKDFALWPEGAENDVVCHEAAPGTASAWTFIEIDPVKQEAISISDFSYNLIDVMAVPYAIKDIAEVNDGVHTYAVKKITQETNESGEMVTTVELYEKNEFAAGEPCILALGNWESSEEDAPYESFDLLIPFPEGDIVDHTHSFVANGIVGGLHGISLSNVGVSTGKDFIPYSGSFGAQTGVIDPATYTGEVEGVETAATIVIYGDLNAISDREPGDVNGDGDVNTADVTAVYSYIISGDESGFTKAIADVNGDGDVNTADVTAIYGIIIGGASGSKAAKSGAFYPGADDNSMGCFVEDGDDQSKIAVTLTLENPTVVMNACEASLEIFKVNDADELETIEGSVDKFIFKGRKAEYSGDDRWTEDHSTMFNKGSQEHGTNSLFISIKNEYLDPFTGTEGTIITVYFDGSDFADGKYAVKMFDALGVDEKAVAYKVPDVVAYFGIADGKVTAVTSAVAEAVAAGKAVYTLDGKAVTAPQKGQIYVVDGKTVKF